MIYFYRFLSDFYYMLSFISLLQQKLYQYLFFKTPLQLIPQVRKPSETVLCTPLLHPLPLHALCKEDLCVTVCHSETSGFQVCFLFHSLDGNVIDESNFICFYFCLGLLLSFLIKVLLFTEVFNTGYQQYDIQPLAEGPSQFQREFPATFPYACVVG